MFAWGAQFHPDNDIPDLSSKVILVTGGNTGLGKESCLQFAKHHAGHIWLAARTESKAQSAIDEIKKTVPDAKISFLPLDLTSMQSIGDAAKMFQSKSDRLDLLLNNAGIMAVPVGTTKEGYEIQLGTNHIGHFLLTKLLLPTLQKTAEQPGSDVRIVNMSSMGHQMAPNVGINFEDHHLPAASTWTRYGQSKLANILFASELARRYPNITSVAVHPGVVNTDLINSYNDSNTLFKYVYGMFSGLVFNDVPTGTKNQLWASTVAKDKLDSGAYYVPVGKKNAGSKQARDAELAKQLWEWSEREVQKHGY